MGFDTRRISQSFGTKSKGLISNSSRVTLTRNTDSASVFPCKAGNMTEEKESNIGLMGHIEAGKTAELSDPELEPDSEAGEQIYIDDYRLRCDHIDVQPKTIVLPKFVFNFGMGYKEKSPLLLKFFSEHQNSVFAKVLKAASTGFKKFEIDFLSPDSKEVYSTWTFTEARIQAVDFGCVAAQRPTPAEFAVEIDYKHLLIGDVSI